MFKKEKSFGIPPAFLAMLKSLFFIESAVSIFLQ